MEEMLIDLLGFALKLLVVIGALGILVLVVVAILKSLKDLSLDEEKLKITDLREQSEECQKELLDFMHEHAADPKVRQEKDKKSKKEEKQAARQRYEERMAEIKKEEEQGNFCPENLYVLDFKGDTSASTVTELSREIDALLEHATEQDEVVVRLTSPGGMVNSYGLAAAQLMRIRWHHVHLTVCVDSVAASGGYMMACVAEKIIAAPFAYIGSIGVLAQIPNFHRLMDDKKIDYEQITAGKYKRTLTMFGENTEEQRQKLKSELELIHRRFKEEVKSFRPQLDIEAFATGEVWLATDAKERGLVDEIETSSSYLMRRIKQTHNCALQLKWQRKEDKSIIAKIKKLLKAKTWVKTIKKAVVEEAAADQLRIR
ncbi:MAG: protease SohB [Succinivibrio sp.]|nr:protease SohB [Succinivibrio sp.]